MTQNNMFVLTNGDVFIDVTGLTFNINEAILFQDIRYVENVEDFKFAKVAIEVTPEIHGTPVNCAIRHYAAVTNDGEFIKTSPYNPFEPQRYDSVKTLKEASLFSSNDGLWRDLHKQIVAAVMKDVFFIKVYVKFNRVVKLVDDHVQPATAKQCDSRTATPSIKNAIVSRGGIKISVKGESGCGKDIFVQSVLKAAESAKLDAMTVYNRHGGNEKPEEVIFICVNEKDWRDE